MRVNYIYKKEMEGGIKYFSSSGSTIELKEYMDDLILYTPTNISYKAEFALNDPIARYSVKPELFTGGPFGSYIKLTDTYSFDIKNFDSLTDNNARISFWLGTNKLTDYTKQALKIKDEYKDGIPTGSYSFTVAVEGQPVSTMILNCNSTTTLKTLKNKILFKLDPSIYPFSISTTNKEEDKIILQSNFEGKKIKISNGLDGNNLLDYFTIEEAEYGSSPEETADVLKLFNLTISHFRNTSTGTPISCLRFTLDGETPQIVEVPWNSDSIHLDNIEVDFDTNVMYVFINGKLVKIEILTNKFHKTEQTLTLSGHIRAPYSFDEIIINKRFIHTKDFQVPDYQLTKYTTKRPYIDYYFAGSELKNGMNLLTNTQQNIHAVLNDGGNYYYYNTGSWRRSNGTYSQSNDWSTFSQKISAYEFSGNDIFIRCFFDSNGTDIAYLDTPYFSISDELYQDGNGNTAAILVGTKEWNEDGEDLKEDMYGKVLVIDTDQGSTTIEFVPEDGSTTLPMTLDEIIEYVNSYYPDGIANMQKDTKDRAVLISEIKGEDAYIKLSGDAAPIIFGDTFSAQGFDPSAGTVSYDEFCKKVRTYTGEPLITMEISDEQIKMYLKEALAYYKRWKGDNINTYTCQLKGDPEIGYEIPKVVENQRDIVDILFKPVFPLNFYGTELLDNSSDNIFTLTLANNLFGGRGARGSENIAQDYYISVMSLQDFKQTLGLNPTWEIMNNRIFIYPARVARFTNVCIRYKAPLSEEEALNDPDVIRYVFYRSCLALGLIRGQFGSNLSVGEAALTFNADTLIELGKSGMKEVMDYWMNSSPPLGFFLG